MEEIIKELLDWGIIISGVSLAEDNSLAYCIKDFYESDNVILYQVNGIFYVKSKYEEITNLGDKASDVLYQLTLLNYEWWIKSKDLFKVWIKPDVRWAYLYDEFKLQYK